VRAALGGSRTHILRQLLQETLALSLVATVAGLALAWWLTPIMIAMAPSQLPRLSSAGVDVRIAAFAVALTALTTFLFGGKRFTLNGDVHEIVGVVPVVKHREYDDPAAPAFYGVNRQLPTWATPHYIVRTRGDAAAAIPMIRQAIESTEPRSAITTIDTMEAMMARSVAEERFRTQLSALFGATALLLAALGVYGLIARDVADRRREIGVRMALGADGRRVATMVLRQALTLVAAGLAVGVPAAFAGSRLVESLLFGVSAASPHAFAIVGVVLGAAAVCASLIPARRAARVDPVVAMRE
jgi:putative ABC transport system permease protein